MVGGDLVELRRLPHGLAGEVHVGLGLHEKAAGPAELRLRHQGLVRLVCILLGVAHGDEEDVVGVCLEQGLHLEVGEQAAVLHGDVLDAQLLEHRARLRGLCLSADAAAVGDGEQGRGRLLTRRHVCHDALDRAGDAAHVALVCLLVSGDSAEDLHHALVVLEGAHLEERCGDAGLGKLSLHLRLAGVLAAPTGASRQYNEVGVERHDGLEVEGGEVAHVCHVLPDAIALEGIA